MNLKRFFCVLTALVLAVGCTGCKTSFGSSDTGKKSSASEKKASDSAQLLYCASDNFNPYTASTDINRQLCRLLYDPLIKYDDHFEPVYCLAQDAVNAGRECRVTLCSAQFSDGMAVTAQDVVYSYTLAKNSATVYASQLYEVASAQAADERTVVFSLTRQDAYLLNLLDFPILKAGSDQRKDADGVLLPPIGCGRYRVSDSGDTLLRSENYYRENNAPATVHLVNAPDGESVAHYVEIGASDIYYTDLSDGKIVRMSGKKTEVPMNHLVYIGINENLAFLQSRELKYAVSSALDRSEICRTSYYNNAVAANGLFHPDFAATKAVQNLKNRADSKIAIENLEKIGYNNLDRDGYRVNASGKRLELTLLVNAENLSRAAAARQIAEEMKAVGIELRVLSCPYAEYVSCLQSGRFQLYLGEIRILPNMDLSPLVLPGGSAAYGVVDQSAQVAAQTPEETGEEPAQPAQAASLPSLIDGFYTGKNGITDVASSLLTELPVIPVCYRMGLLFYRESVGNLSGASQSDIYSAIGK